MNLLVWINRGSAAPFVAFVSVLNLFAGGCSKGGDAKPEEDAGVEMDAGCVPTTWDIENDFLVQALPVCPAELCGGGGRCVPNNFIPPSQSGFLAACDDSSTCVPEDFIGASQAGGEHIPSPCRSVAGAEGRCMSTCLPMVGSQTSLPQGTCPDHHLCVPCYEPFSGEPTSVCNFGCDMPHEEPVTFAACCGALGSCIPTALIPGAFRDYLPEDTCTETNTLCVPNKFIADSGYQPASCDAVRDDGEGGMEDLGPGACLALCLALESDEQAATLQQDTCDDGEVCVPCEIGDEPTGACDIGGGGDPEGDAGM
jgi:hypothetical protein